MIRTLPVAVRSPRIRAGALADNLEACRLAIEDAARTGASLIVLPELATSGYALVDAAQVESCAMRADAPRLLALADGLPATTVLVVGFAERVEGGVANSAAVIAGGQVLATYRKAHLWGGERLLFRAGDAAAPVVETPIGRLGIAICYDIEFPEVPRALKLAGAELLAAPVAWPLVPRPEGERAPELIQAMAAARSSRLPIVIADHHGADRSIEWTGGTAVIDGDGWIAAADERTATVTIPIPADARAGERNDLIGDRRPELYGELGPRHDTEEPLR
ncbi:nitrilase-related carbon-nitrogen hydrolase [Agrococcus sp. BE272]|uniref:nitrilase-related carbon-nitrogen hydrolase n=1 Tax=Agrococcus sp. BE272 TaxID=2817727 RepID=UPI0028611B17|nr:nitrilase-related carbon-nitrogen hydrolase [Agrococcus sp. BE272]MDR7233610.1 putative amidohydrolase [Agrococcus sp. BE272]